MKEIRALGERSVATEQIKDSLVNTGNLYVLFSEAPQPLSSYIRIRQFKSLVEERTRNFVGRDYIFQAIDQYMSDPDFRSGYIIIKGEPGIGKTALIAKIVEQRGYAHHFNISQQQIISIDAFLKNICAQVIVRYDLPHTSLPFPQATTDSGFLSELLSESATKAEHNVVVLVDALDETENHKPNTNTLLLPPVLPEGVFFVVTTRESSDVFLQVDRERSIYISETDPRNVDDVKSYITGFIREHASSMNEAIVNWGVNQERFVDIITEKSEGNFMYLVHVLADIRAGVLNSTNIGDLGNLPAGLRSYYERHWNVMRSPDPGLFERLHQRVICVLASACEAVSLFQLMQWTALTHGEVQRVVREWRQFLNEELSEDGQPLYRIYHASFRDFLKETVGLSPYNNLIATYMDQKVKHYGGC